MYWWNKVSFTLGGELRNKTASAGFKRNYPKRLGTHHIFFGMKLFCLSTYKAKIYSIRLIFIVQNLTRFQVIQTTFIANVFLWGIKVAWTTWTFVRFHEFFIKQMLIIPAMYLDKQKHFAPVQLVNIFKACYRSHDIIWTGLKSSYECIILSFLILWITSWKARRVYFNISQD